MRLDDDHLRVRRSMEFLDDEDVDAPAGNSLAEIGYDPVLARPLSIGPRDLEQFAEGHLLNRILGQ